MIKKKKSTKQTPYQVSFMSNMFVLLVTYVLKIWTVIFSGKIYRTLVILRVGNIETISCQYLVRP